MALNDDIWDRFEAMLRVHAPALLGSLCPPATETEIVEAESAMGVRFPEEVRQAYLRHNGSTSDREAGNGSGLFFVPFSWWASLEEAVGNWHLMVQVSETLRDGDPEGLFATYKPWWDDLKIRPVWWNEKWIPIGLSGTATSVYFDLDPAPKGTVGQLLGDGGMQDPQWVANGLNHYLEMLIDRVERKLLIFREGWVSTETNERVYDWTRIG